MCCNMLTMCCNMLTMCCNMLTMCCNMLTMCCNMLTMCCNMLTICCKAASSAWYRQRKRNGWHQSLSSLKGSCICHCPPLTYIFNVSIQCVFPEIWKCAKVTPLHSKGIKKRSWKLYRLISVLSCVSKVIERHVHDCLYQFLDDYRLLFDGQPGFRPGHACATALMHMIDSWLSVIDEGSMVGVGLTDSSKAFDSVDHSALIHRLASYHCLPMIVDWFKSYLQGRTQRVNIKMGICLTNRMFTCDVPQGSVSGHYSL